MRPWARFCGRVGGSGGSRARARLNKGSELRSVYSIGFIEVLKGGEGSSPACVCDRVRYFPSAIERSCWSGGDVIKLLDVVKQQKLMKNQHFNEKYIMLYNC